MSKVSYTNTAPVEDWDTVVAVEDVFRKKRGFVVKMPIPGTPVITCMSGGLDSTVNIAILLKDYNLEVYPFFINRGQSNLKWEQKAVAFYDNYFKERHSNYHSVKEIDITVPSKSYKAMLRATKHLQDDLFLRKRNTYPARNPIMFLAGMEYGYSLHSQGVFPKVFFIAQHGDDFSVHGSLTLMRITNLMFCWLLGDWEYQFISLPIEKEFGNDYGKEVYVKWADEHGLPLEHTRSCCSADEIQCGRCNMACWDRRMAFKKAGVEDKTVYQYPMPVSYETATSDTKENWKGEGDYNG